MELPEWIRNWPLSRPSLVLAGATSAHIDTATIVSVLCHISRRGDGEDFDQVAIVELADKRWASLVLSVFTKSIPMVISVTVGATWEHVWRFGIGDKERRWLTPQLREPARPESSTEERFLSVLRANPDDAETLHVYADFLEERGDVARAVIVRAATFDPEAPMPLDQARWRALVTDPPIHRCRLAVRRRDEASILAPGCGRRWRTARPTDDALVRECPLEFIHRDRDSVQTGCGSPIHYCTSIEDVASAGAARVSIVLDPALDTAHATATYDAHAHGSPVGDDDVDLFDPGAAPPVDDVEFNPSWSAPDIIIPPGRRSLWSRIRGFFRG